MIKTTKQRGESTIIEAIESDIKAVQIRMTVKNDLGFIIVISSRGFEFYGAEDDSNTLLGTPLVKTPEQVFDWIKNETPERGKKPFCEKVNLDKIARRENQRPAIRTQLKR